MRDLIQYYSDKLSIQKHLFLQEGKFELYNNVQKTKSKIEKETISSTLVKVTDECNLNDETLYLISVNGDEIGWITIESPVFIYNTFPENILVTDTNSDNELNKILNLYTGVNEQEIYIKQFFIIYDNEVYFGIVKDGQLLAFLNEKQVTNGDIEPLGFKFNQIKNNVFEDIYQRISSQFISSDSEYECTKIIYFNNAYFGKFKIGRTSYWFNVKDTNINIDNINSTEEKSIDTLKLEHLLFTPETSLTEESTVKIEEKVILERFEEYNEKIKNLKNEIAQLKNELVKTNNEELNN